MIKIILLCLFLFGIFTKVYCQVYKTVYLDFGPSDMINGNITKKPDANGTYWDNATEKLDRLI